MSNSNNLELRVDEVILKDPELLRQLKDASAEDALAILLNFAHAGNTELDGAAAFEWLSMHNEAAGELSLEKLEELVGGAAGFGVPSFSETMRRRANTFTGKNKPVAKEDP